MLKSSINLKRNEMGKISNYVQDADVKLNDKLLGSDESGTTNNYTITSISKIFKEANAAGVGGQFTYKLDAGAGVGIESGEMDATFSGGDLDFADVTAIKVSIYTYENPTTNLTNALSILNSKKILIVDVNNHNNYGIYSTGTISISSGVGSLSLTYVSGNGAMVDDKVYAITVNYPDGDTTYSISCVDGDATEQEKIRLTNSAGATDDIVLEAGVGLQITRVDDRILYNVSSVPNAAMLNALANLETSGGAADENITFGKDSGDTIVVTGNLQVSGTTTTVNSTTVNLNDHNIVLDSGNSTSAVVNEAGITLEGGSGDDVTWMWNTTGTAMELKLGSSLTAAKFGNITGTLQTAAQTNITSLGTLTSLTVSNGVELTGSHLTLADEVKLKMGADSDFNIYHAPGTHSPDGGTINVGSWITSDSGNLLIHQSDADQDIIFMNDNGSGGDAIYMTLDGGAKTVDISVPLNVTTDADITGSVKCTQNLRRTITAVTLSTNTATCTLTANDNFSFTLNNAANTINIVTAAENVGQSGTIIATNPSSVGSFSVNQIQGNGDAAEVLTPDGATISWPTNANGVNLISYYVAAQDKILINFIGNFTNP